MSRPAWRGALHIAGFPIHVKIHNRLKSPGKGEGFRMLAPNGQPIRQQLVDTDGNVVERSETLKGVENGDGYIALSEDQLGMIETLQRSELVEPKQFVPVEQIDRALAKTAYDVVPDKDVAGSEGPLEQFGDYLQENGKAVTYQLAARAGSADFVLAVYAEDGHVKAVTLPFEEEVHPEQEWSFEFDSATGKKMGQMIEQVHGDLVGDLAMDSYKSEYKESRRAAIESALSGAPAPGPSKTPEKAPTEDLMAALADAVKTAAPKKAAAKKKAPKKAGATRRTKVKS